MAPAAELTSRFVCTEDAEGAPEEVTLLSARDRVGCRKDVLRLAVPNADNGSLIAKVFRLRNLRRRFRYQILGYNRFGLGEAVNLITAAKRGLKVPRVCGYGYIRGPSGLIKTSMVVLEDLTPCASVGEVLRRETGNQDRCLEVLRKVVPIFAGLFRAGCNHIDVNLGAILLDMENSETAFLVDFEHATFGDQPSLEVLAFEAAYFAKCCSEYIEEEALRKWLVELMDAAAITKRTERVTTTDRFNHYLSLSLSRKERRRIG